MWKFSIADCISFIKQCHDDLTALCVNSCWRIMWPEVVNDFAGFPTVDQDEQHIVQLAHQVGGEGFDDLQEEEVQEELLGHAGEELAKLVEEQRHEDEEEEGEVEEVPTLTVMGLNRFLLASRALGDIIRDRSLYQEISQLQERDGAAPASLPGNNEGTQVQGCSASNYHVLPAFVHSKPFTFYTCKRASAFCLCISSS
ncbi:putative Tigger transposable element-derived protein 1-like 314 [Homarus americanus]|uniref:Putative Tigger transposable element-derived protein 1-like 314 n=1 Tax=Homarus americanus TaxID=6706 RepID=A0A8J5MYW7_HOMAM|nr:putative Tigger transposable element-derived protein 1-like 314 [Homarus americanus]